MTRAVCTSCHRACRSRVAVAALDCTSATARRNSGSMAPKAATAQEVATAVMLAGCWKVPAYYVADMVTAAISHIVTAAPAVADAGIVNTADAGVVS